MKNLIDYLLKNDLAEIPKKGRRELKSIIINNQKIDTIRTNRCQTNFKRNYIKSVKNANEYRSYANNKLSLSLGMKKH